MNQHLRIEDNVLVLDAAKEVERIVATLRQQVTSKGGTTDAAVRAFEGANLRGIVAAALGAASDRGREMAQAFGNAKKS